MPSHLGNGNLINNPCQMMCLKRSITCHGNCEAYSQYRTDLEKEKRKIRNQRIRMLSAPWTRDSVLMKKNGRVK